MDHTKVAKKLWNSKGYVGILLIFHVSVDPDVATSEVVKVGSLLLRVAEGLCTISRTPMRRTGAHARACTATHNNAQPREIAHSIA